MYVYYAHSGTWLSEQKNYILNEVQTLGAYYFVHAYNVYGPRVL